MKKRIVYISIIALLFILNLILATSFLSLNNKSKKDTLKMSGDFNFVQIVDSALSAFIKEVNNKNCYFEVYIDKKDDTLTYISLIASQYYSNDIAQNPKIINEYIFTYKPSYYEKRDGVNIFVYTGIEQIICFKEKTVNLHSVAKFRNEYFWTVVLKNNKYTIYKDISIKPFLKDTVDFDKYKKIRFIVP